MRKFKVERTRKGEKKPDNEVIVEVNDHEYQYHACIKAANNSDWALMGTFDYKATEIK